MTELLTAAQMRALESQAIEAGDVTGLELMERAGAGVTEAVFEEWPDLSEGGRRALVLCGPGNNGGDGFVVARLLTERGWKVEVFLLGDPAKLPPDARANAKRWDGQVHPLTPAAVHGQGRPDLFVDAVFGIGLTRPVPDDVAMALDLRFAKSWQQKYKVRKVAIDCPSGLDLDTGHVPVDMAAVENDGPWPKTVNSADLTVTFHSPKPGHYLGMGPMLCTKLQVVDIGLRGDASERASVGMPPDPERARLVEPRFMDRDIPHWPQNGIGKHRMGGHKYEHGHVMVFAGGVGRGGAGRLAARAALRVGAGLVTVVCPPAALQENACQLNAVMLKALAKDQDLGQVADDRVSAFCLGPGLGLSARTRQRVREVLERRAGGRDWRDPLVVLDADALSVFADAPETLFAQTHARTILTPHDGEFERLFPDLAKAARGGRSKLDVVRDAADRAGCVLLLKGADTVIAEPGGGASVHAAAYAREAPWLATAGAGDVLAGLIAGLAGSPVANDLFAMAEVAAWLHVECARSFGPGLIAEDLPEELPKVFRQLAL